MVALARRISTRELPVNDKLLNEAIRHAHAIERYKLGVQRQILSYIDKEVYPDLLKQMERQLKRLYRPGVKASPRRLKQLQEMFQSMDGILRVGLGEAYKQTRSELFSFATLDAAWQQSTLTGALATGLEVSFTTPAPVLLRSIVVSRPFQTKLLREHYASLTSETRKGYRKAIKTGMATGESIPQITRRITGTGATNLGGQVLPTARRRTTAIVRTAVNHVSSHAREETFKSNKDVIGKVQYVATLDARTTDICAGLDGKTFKIGRGPRPPMHHQCRSTVVPVLKSWKELGIDLKEAPTGTRASMNGEEPATQTYGPWLKKQPRGVQDEVLGPGRAKLFREGLPIEKFTDSKYRPISLQRLERMIAER